MQEPSRCSYHNTLQQCLPPHSYEQAPTEPVSESLAHRLPGTRICHLKNEFTSKEASWDTHSASYLLFLLPWNQSLAVGLCCKFIIIPRKVSEETSCFCLKVSDFLASEPLPCCLSLVLGPELSSELLPCCCLSPRLSIESITLPINSIPCTTYFSVCLGHPYPHQKPLTMEGKTCPGSWPNELGVTQQIGLQHNVTTEGKGISCKSFLAGRGR